MISNATRDTRRVNTYIFDMVLPAFLPHNPRFRMATITTPITTHTRIELQALMDDDIVKYVANKLNAYELRLYLQSMVTCIRSTDPYPIPFDTVVEWLGKQKSHLKRTLLGKLEENDDYIIARRPSPEGGRPSEEILLTVRGFKTLCSRSRGKRAEAVQDYFIKVESLVVEFAVERWKNTCASRAELNETVELLNAKITDLTRVIDKEDALKDDENEGLVYIITSDVLDAVKIGYTKGTNEKLHRRYVTCYGQNMTIHCRRFNDAVRMEKVLHVRFDEHRKTGELFDKRYFGRYIEFMEKLS